MMITYGLMEKLDEIAEQEPDRARVLNKATVTELISENGVVIGCKYTRKGEVFTEYGPVILATGGFGADFSDTSLLQSVENEWKTLSAWQTDSRAGKQNKGKSLDAPGLRTLPTTNGPHCTGDGIKMATSLGADTFDMHCVQIHPTGLVDPAEPDAKVKFLAAEALRGCGGVLLDNQGERFADELGKRDYVTGRMWGHKKGPYRLVLNSKAAAQIAWHCEHYSSRGLMREMSGAELAKEMGVTQKKLQGTFDVYNKAAENPGTDEFGKKFFNATPVMADDKFMVAIVCPVVHYCMGGVAGGPDGRVLNKAGQAIPGLYAAGEVLGGVHGTNRLGGSSLLDCVVFGRVSGRTACMDLLKDVLKNGGGGGGANASAPGVNVKVSPNAGGVSFDISWDGAGGAKAKPAGGNSSVGDDDAEVDPNVAFYSQGVGGADDKKKASGGGGGEKTYSPAEVAKHTTDTDCWVILHDKVYDVTDFLDDHPGGKKAIMIYAGKDATKEFDMLHKMDILTKYAAEYCLGPLVVAKL
jgi:hypothetical protein